MELEPAAGLAPIDAGVTLSTPAVFTIEVPSGLTPDIIKRKYNWILNAIVDNAIIGQDDYGFVWYSGSWIAGEWEDGTWYSGIWYDGEW